jgi:hypothetical protein
MSSFPNQSGKLYHCKSKDKTEMSGDSIGGLLNIEQIPDSETQTHHYDSIEEVPHELQK